MGTKVSAEAALSDANGVQKVWKENPQIKLGKNSETVTLENYQASIASVSGLTATIEDKRHELNGLLDQRDNAAATLNALNCRALSAIRGIFGPDSAEYELAGGTRASERKHPARRKAETK